MLIDLKRTIIFVCPRCTGTNTKLLSVFNFSGKHNAKLICPTQGCHELCAVITEKKDNYTIEVECPICSEKHRFTISRSNLWNKPLVQLHCPASNIAIVFIGEKEKVESALAEEMQKLYETSSHNPDNREYVEESFLILYSILEKLTNMKKKHKVTCSCGSENIEFYTINGNVIINCRECNKSKLIEGTKQALARLARATSVKLTD